MNDVPSQEQPLANGEAPSGATDLREDDTEHAARTRPFLQPPPPRRTAARPSDPAPMQPPAPSLRRARPESATRRGYAPPPTGAASPSVPAPVPTAQRRSRSRRSATPPSESGLYLPWWSLVVMVAVVAVMTVIVVMVFATLTEPAALGDQQPRVQVITSQPTLSQDFAAPGAQTQGESLWPTAIRPAEPTVTMALPTLAPSPSLPPGEFALGVRVEVVGVGGSGLNVRPAATTRADPLFLAREGEVFAIVGGPQSSDGIEWWKIEDPRDAERVGWAARNYLTVAVQ